MRIVCALDVHRRQITCLTVDAGSGQVSRGRISPATRGSVREWLARFDGVDAVHLALEGTTGWRFVVEEIERAGHRAHLADPAETAARRGRKRRAKTDRADCDLLLKLLAAGELPESWIPSAQILELRTRVRLRKTLIDERTAWQQRLQAQLFHQGAPAGLRPRTRAGREALAGVELSPAGRELVALALRMIDGVDRELAPLDSVLSRFARRQPGCRALIARLYGVGPVTATAIVAELGDARRLAAPTTLSATADSTSLCTSRTASARPSSLARRPGAVRWALFEAAQQACRPASPDYQYYRQVARRIDHNRACLSVARKLCRRAYHILRELGDEALAPIEPAPLDEEVITAAA
jgi:transposase